MLSPGDSVDLKNIRFPAVLKVCSSNIIHKTEVKGTCLNILDQKDLLQRMKEFSSRFPGEKLLVEPQEQGIVEVILGLVDDSTFGMTVMVGLGGVFAETLRDVSFRVVPLERDDAVEMIKDLRGHSLLEEFRGTRVNTDAIVDMILRLCVLGEELGMYISQLDLNPVLLREEDAIAVDAKIMLKD